MDLPSPEIRRGLVIGIPIMVVLLLALLRWWLYSPPLSTSPRGWSVFSGVSDLGRASERLRRQIFYL